MATNPNRRNARGIWKLKNIQSFKQDGEYPNGGAIGIFAGGGGPSSNVIDFIQASSTGNAADFGDLTATTVGCSTTSNSTRCLVSGGYEPSVQWSNKISYITPSTKGNTADFGNLTTGCGYPAGMSNNTRVIQSNGHEGAGGSTALNTEMDTMLFASLGNSTDFGDMTSPAKYGEAAASNSVRGIVAGGRDPDASPIYINDIDMFNFASTGSASDFGDLLQATHYFGGCSDGTTALFINGTQNASSTQAVQIMSTGNATDFNDTAIHSNGAPMAAGNRAINAGGRTSNPGPAVNIIEYFDIKSRADAVDFGDLTVSRLFYGPSADSTNNGGQEVTPGQLGIPRPGLEHLKDRAFILGGQTPSTINVVDSILISSKANAIDFGDLTGVRDQQGAAGNHIKALSSNGKLAGSNDAQTDSLHFASEGNATNFGDASLHRYSPASLGNDTRAVFVGGHTPSKVNTIDFHVFATEGNASDFGDATTVLNKAGSTASSTRGITGGGNRPNASNVIDYITIASTGNSTDFGDLTVARSNLGGGGSSVRGLFAGVYPVGNVIDFVTISSTGDASDFGDLTVSRSTQNGSMGSNTRALFAGGYIYPASPAVSDVIDFVTIASTGNAADHGDLTAGRQNHAGASNGHGGL